MYNVKKNKNKKKQKKKTENIFKKPMRYDFLKTFTKGLLSAKIPAEKATHSKLFTTFTEMIINMLHSRNILMKTNDMEMNKIFASSN